MGHAMDNMFKTMHDHAGKTSDNALKHTRIPSELQERPTPCGQQNSRKGQEDSAGDNGGKTDAADNLGRAGERQRGGAPK